MSRFPLGYVHCYVFVLILTFWYLIHLLHKLSYYWFCKKHCYQHLCLAPQCTLVGYWPSNLYFPPNMWNMVKAKSRCNCWRLKSKSSFGRWTRLRKLSSKSLQVEHGQSKIKALEAELDMVKAKVEGVGKRLKDSEVESEKKIKEAKQQEAMEAKLQGIEDQFSWLNY